MPTVQSADVDTTTAAVTAVTTGRPRPVVAFGPELPGIASWEWVGSELIAELGGVFDTVSFRETPPGADVVVFVKVLPPPEVFWETCRRSRVIYAPVDRYGSAREIEREWRLLRACRRVLVSAEFIDHHLRFTPPGDPEPRPWPPAEPVVLWTGHRSNLPPLACWVNRHALPGPLHVLTNLDGRDSAPPDEFGFDGSVPVRVEAWSPARETAALAAADLAIDIKGEDFRQRHKPATKAVDFLAAGLPLAMNPGSSPAMRLARLGFEVCSPLERERWLSADYRAETRLVGTALRELFSRRTIGRRWRTMIEAVLTEPLGGASR
jgi:hypothetical protein